MGSGLLKAIAPPLKDLIPGRNSKLCIDQACAIWLSSLKQITHHHLTLHRSLRITPININISLIYPCANPYPATSATTRTTSGSIVKNLFSKRFETMSGNGAAVLEKKRDLQPWVSGRFHALSFSIQLCLTLTHVSYEASLLKHQVCFSLRDP